MSGQVIRTRVWRNGTLEKTDFPFEQISHYLAQPDCLVWADLCAPESDCLDQLAQDLNLDRHAVEDAVTEHERPKATRYATHLFVTMSALVDDPAAGVVHSARVSAFSVANGLFTVRLDDRFGMDEVMRRWDDNADLINCGPRALVHGLLDVIVDGYFDAIESLDGRIEACEDVLFEDNAQLAKELQRKMFALRKALVQCRRAILPMREVVNTVMRRATEGNHDVELTPFYEDLYDHVLRAAEWTESLRDMISSVFETSMSLADTRMNMIMKKLTSWAAIIAVPTAITGFYGQNVPYPGFGHTWGFWFSVAAIVLIAVG
mgnify:CR=1 FL=1